MGTQGWTAAISFSVKAMITRPRGARRPIRERRALKADDARAVLRGGQPAAREIAEDDA